MANFIVSENETIYTDAKEWISEMLEYANTNSHLFWCLAESPPYIRYAATDIQNPDPSHVKYFGVTLGAFKSYQSQLFEVAFGIKTHQARQRIAAHLTSEEGREKIKLFLETL